MGGGVFLRYAAQQQNDFGQCQLSHRTGIGVGRIEYRNTGTGCGIQIDLIGADAETADGDQFGGLFQNGCVQLRA
jgi:hypothetical protein